MVKVAVIDVGTVTARLAVSVVEDGRVVSMERRSEIVNLGQGVDATGVLREDAMERLFAVIDTYLDIIARSAVDATCCTMTSAARDASNSDVLVGRFRQRGLAAQVIPGKVEGMMTFLGVAQDFSDMPILVADNGGGSTEFALGRLSSEKGLDLAMVRSIDVGCRRITEKFLPGEGPASQDGVEAAHAFAREAFSVVNTWVDETGCVPEHLIVTGGTVTTIVALEKELVPYDSSQVHLATLTREQTDGLERRLAALSVEGRASLPGIQVKRAPVILGGVIAVGEVMRAAGFTELTVSESDLLVGLSITCACAAEGLETPVGWKPQLG
jgi:exopolyphosphatase/guanosine-5'-triphosphate,3'-diphosphate pyrophosphatase